MNSDIPANLLELKLEAKVMSGIHGYRKVAAVVSGRTRLQKAGYVSIAQAWAH